MKIKIEATIPTTQYGNLRPTFELEEEGDDSKAFEQLAKMWSVYGETPLKVKHAVPNSTASVVEIQTFTGETLLWNEVDHVYTDKEGNVMLSGSKYADQNSPKFDLEMMLPKTATAWGVDVDALRDLWKLNGTVSTHWGSAIHNALEIYHNHWRMGENIQEKKELEHNYVLPKIPYLRAVVEDFIKKFGTEEAIAEAVISDVKNQMAGTVDRLAITGNKKCRIGDYKTNAVMDKKKMAKYQLQLSFYAKIMENHGWTVEGLDLFHYDDETGWSKEEMEVLPVALDK